MTIHVFVCAGAVVKAPIGSMRDNYGNGTREASVIPILKRDPALHTYSRPALNIDINKRLVVDSGQPTMQMEGFGLTHRDGDELPPLGMIPPSEDDLTLTTLGGQWPKGFSYGRVYFHSSVLRDFEMVFRNQGGVPMEGYDNIEHVTIFDDVAKRRYLGYRATVIGAMSGGRASVSLMTRDGDKNPIIEMPLDDASCYVVPVSMPSYPGWKFTPLKPSSPPAPGTVVDVLVDMQLIVKTAADRRTQDLLAGPKVPFWLG